MTDQQNQIMNQRLLSINSNKFRFQSYYIKKLQTQTSFSKDVETSQSQNNQIIQRQILQMEKNLHKKNTLYKKTLRRKSELEDEEQKSRSDLKSRIEQKMRKSQQNMLSIRQKSNSSLSARLKAESKKIQQIKKLQKTIYNQKYELVKELSCKTEQFFKDLHQRNKKSKLISVDTSQFMKTRQKQSLLFPINYQNHKIQSNQKTTHPSISNPEHQKLKISLLKTPRQTILQKQIKKINLEKCKENSFIKDYIKKLESIQASRKKVWIQKRIPQTTIAKFINKQVSQQAFLSKKKISKSSVKEVVTSKKSFSQLYQKKLQEKKEKKSFFLSQSIIQGDCFLKQDFKQSSRYKLGKIIKESQNQLARKENFRYMQRFLSKKF